jgi:malate dehydrogenase (quinone)
MMGEAKIDTGIGAIFNMTPSPGATCCLENAEVDMRSVAGFLGARVDEDAFARDLLIGDQRHDSADLPAHIITGADAA